MKKYFLFPIVTGILVWSLVFSGCSNSGEKKQDDGAAPADTSKGVSAMVAHDSIHSKDTSTVYICPCGGCPEVREPKAGNCRKCGLELVKEKK